MDESCSYAEVLRKLGLRDCGGNYATLKRKIEIEEINLDAINRNRIIANKQRANSQHKDGTFKQPVPLEDVLTGNAKILSSYHLKDRLIKEGYKEKKCERCGLTEWLGEPIPLHLHHKDGNHDNNLMNNLEILCPNCHALTDNYTGKNIKITKRSKSDKIKKKLKSDKIKTKIRPKKSQDICPICKINYLSKRASMCMECYRKNQFPDIAREQLKEEIRMYSFLKVGEKHNVSDNTIRKWCKKLNLPFRRKDINEYTDEAWKMV